MGKSLRYHLHFLTNTSFMQARGRKLQELTGRDLLTCTYHAHDIPEPADEARLILLCDSDDSIRRAKQTGYPVIAVSHHDNSSQSLMGCPFMVSSMEALEPSFLDLVYCRHYELPLTILYMKTCCLRELTLADLPFLLDLQSDNAGNLDGCFFPENVSDPESYLSDYIRCQYPFYGWGIYGIIHQEEGCLIGIAGFSPHSDSVLEVGYSLREEWRHQGILSAILPGLLDYGRQTCPGMDLICFTDPANTPSLRLAQKCGLPVIYTGTAP